MLWWPSQTKTKASSNMAKVVDRKINIDLLKFSMGRFELSLVRLAVVAVLEIKPPKKPVIMAPAFDPK